MGAFAAWRLLQDGQGNELSGAPDNVQSVLMLEAREACWGATGRVGSLSLLALSAQPVRAWLLRRRMIHTGNTAPEDAFPLFLYHFFILRYHTS